MFTHQIALIALTLGALPLLPARAATSPIVPPEQEETEEEGNEESALQSFEDTLAERTEENRAPTAVDDDFGVRPGRTTILSVRRGGTVAMGGDGQVTHGNTVMKGNARKVRRLYGDTVLAGFAGGTADAFTLFERFEGKLEKYGNLTRAAIELAKDWRTDRALRRLGAANRPHGVAMAMRLGVLADST